MLRKWIRLKYLFFSVSTKSIKPQLLHRVLRWFSQRSEHLTSPIFMSVQSLLWPDHVLRCLSRLGPPSSVLCMVVMQRLLYRVTCPNYDIFCTCSIHNYCFFFFIPVGEYWGAFSFIYCRASGSFFCLNLDGLAKSMDLFLLPLTSSQVA